MFNSDKIKQLEKNYAFLLEKYSELSKENDRYVDCSICGCKVLRSRANDKNEIVDGINMVETKQRLTSGEYTSSREFVIAKKIKTTYMCKHCYGTGCAATHVDKKKK